MVPLFSLTHDSSQDSKLAVLVVDIPRSLFPSSLSGRSPLLLRFFFSSAALAAAYPSSFAISAATTGDESPKNCGPETDDRFRVMARSFTAGITFCHVDVGDWQVNTRGGVCDRKGKRSVLYR